MQDRSSICRAKFLPREELGELFLMTKMYPTCRCKESEKNPI